MKIPSLSTNYIDRSLGRSALLPVLLLLACFALSPQARAVSPPPEGCYPNYTTAAGCDALNFLSTGAGNTGLGWHSLWVDSTGSFNTGVGAGALALNIADSNTAVGAGAMLLNTIGTGNTAVGTNAMVFSEGFGNTADGVEALLSNIVGGFNTAVGASALNNNITGSSNVALGNGAGNAVTTANNVICIGALVAGADVDNTTWIGNVWGVTTQSGNTTPVIVSADGQLGTVVSSERFKKDIATMDKASEAILSLRPVTFHYKSDLKGTAQFGLIAEDVAKVNPALVLSDKERKPYTVRYDAVNAMLLNEFLKEHKAFVEEQRKVEKLETIVTSLVATAKAQATQIQKVSAQLEASRRVQEMVVSDP